MIDLPFTGVIREVGGGVVEIVVDRNTLEYPTPGTHVTVAPFESWGAELTTGAMVIFMHPGHFSPDVCTVEDFGVPETLRGRVVKGFFQVMRAWPKPTEEEPPSSDPRPLP